VGKLPVVTPELSPSFSSRWRLWGQCEIFAFHRASRTRHYLQLLMRDRRLYWPPASIINSPHIINIYMYKATSILVSRVFVHMYSTYSRNSNLMPTGGKGMPSPIRLPNAMKYNSFSFFLIESSASPLQERTNASLLI